MSNVITSLRLVVLSFGVCCVLYPAAILAFAVVAAPESRVGSLTRDGKGKLVGSRLLAQNFTRPEYFWPRPSACDYNASAAGGSNLSPTNPKLTERAQELIQKFQAAASNPVPADLVAASGSGLDPNITLSAALFQAARVAEARKVSLAAVEQIVREHRDSPTLDALGGQPLVNVLLLNLALDQGTKSFNR